MYEVFPFDYMSFAFRITIFPVPREIGLVAVIKPQGRRQLGRTGCLTTTNAYGIAYAQGATSSQSLLWTRVARRPASPQVPIDLDDNLIRPAFG